MSGELLILTVALILAWGVALVAYLPTIQIRRWTKQDDVIEDLDDAA